MHCYQTPGRLTLFAGAAGSGLGFHAHGEAFNALVRGRKLCVIIITRAARHIVKLS
jgi:hypothetical protein